MFQFPAFASIIQWMTGLQPAGLSHSEIRGSKVICTYPQLIAAYHVLHRLREPRHPPCALNYLSFILELSLKKYDCKQTILLKDKVYTFSLYFYFTKSFFFGLFIMSKIDST